MISLHYDAETPLCKINTFSQVATENISRVRSVAIYLSARLLDKLELSLLH